MYKTIQFFQIGSCSQVLSILRVFYDETKYLPDKQFSDIISKC